MIIQQLFQTPEKNQQAMSPQQMSQISFDNIVSSVNWNNIDILISTPHQLNQIIDQKIKLNKNDIDPTIIILDEMDLLLGDSNIAKATKSIVQRFKQKKRQVIINICHRVLNINFHFKSSITQEFQFILCGASLPQKLDNQDSSQAIAEYFGTLQNLESPDFHKLPLNITHQIINLCETLEMEEFKNKTSLDILLEIIKKSSSKKILIFCSGLEKIQQISKFLQENRFLTLPLHAQMSTEIRMETISKFEKNEIQILVSSDLASRGLDLDVDHIIQYDFASNAVSLLHRFGRTGRVGKKGKVTSFVRPEDAFLLSKVLDKESQHQSLFPIFSRKRSLQKMSKKNDVSDDSSDHSDSN